MTLVGSEARPAAERGLEAIADAVWGGRHRARLAGEQQFDPERFWISLTRVPSGAGFDGEAALSFSALSSSDGLPRLFEELVRFGRAIRSLGGGLALCRGFSQGFPAGMHRFLLSRLGAGGALEPEGEACFAGPASLLEAFAALAPRSDFGRGAPFVRRFEITLSFQFTSRKTPMAEKIPVEMELGALEIAESDFLRLLPGETLEFEAPPPLEVTLRAGGRVWARGTLELGGGSARIALTRIFTDAAGNFLGRGAISLSDGDSPGAGGPSAGLGGPIE